MASKVDTVEIVDSRIQPQPDPVYAVTVAPVQNQFYKIPASGLSNSYITFNNLTTLGADRAYLDTFELEITATITFKFNQANAVPAGEGHYANYNLVLSNWEWNFDSFPFNKCCEEIRVNVNGGAFFSSPLSYLRAKERYWSDKKLVKSYAGTCPTGKPWLVNELGYTHHAGSTGQYYHEDTFMKIPSRLSPFNLGYAFTAYGVNGEMNKVMTWPLNPVPAADSDFRDITTTVTWREPIFCSPFSSRLDATYGRPLYNITSLDLAFNLQNLGNMIRVSNKWVDSYSINIDSCNLCYQVETLPKGIPPPPKTVVPYRRFVPYITDYPSNPVPFHATPSGEKITITSGVYTLNEVPQAIWMFLAPTKSALQNNDPDGWGVNLYNGYTPNTKSWTFNKGFGNIVKVSLSCGNTTQILNTATDTDLFRIAKANGCQDNFTQWVKQVYPTGSNFYDRVNSPGSVLRLIPGVDIVLPDQTLIPGANAHNLVFQATMDVYVPGGFPPNYRNVALWLLFEYNGVATISPGQCQIEMNPLGEGRVSPSRVMSSAQSEPISTVEGSGWWDKIKEIAKNIGQVAQDTKFASKAAKFIPGIGPIASQVLDTLGYGSLGGKRPRPADYDGGAVMGYGDFC